MDRVENTQKQKCHHQPNEIDRDGTRAARGLFKAECADCPEHGRQKRKQLADEE